MARAVRLQLSPTAPTTDLYAAFDSGEIFNRGTGGTISSGYFRNNPALPWLVGFTVTDWTVTRKGYTGTSDGAVRTFGGATAPSGYTTPIYGTSNAGRDFVANPAGNGQAVFLKYNGEVSGVGGLSAVVSAAIYGGQDYARRIVVTSWSPVQGYILKMDGGVSAFGGATLNTLASQTYITTGSDMYRAVQVNSGDAVVMRGTGQTYEVTTTTPKVTPSQISTGDIYTDLKVTSWTPSFTAYKLNQSGSVFEVKGASTPTFTWTTPTALSTVSDQTHPLIGGDYFDADGDGLVAIEMWVYDKATTLQPGFAVGPPNLEMYPTVWRYSSTSEPSDVGPLVPLGLNGTPGEFVLPAATYRAYARVTDQQGTQSVITGPHEFSLEYNPGAPARIEVTPDSSIAAAHLTVQVPDNMLSKQQANFEAAAGVEWVGATNCTVARSTTFFHRGTASMSMTATAGGLMRAGTSPRIPARPGVPYTLMARVRRGATGRNVRLVQKEYNSAGTFLREQDGPWVPQLDDAGNDIVDAPTDPSLPTAVINMSPLNPTSGDLITFSGASSSDPGGLTLTYQWLRTSGPAMTFLPNASSATVTATAPTVTSNTDAGVALRVTNSAGLQSELVEFNYAISPSTAPVVKPIAQIEVGGAGATPLPGQVSNFNAVSSYDPSNRGALTRQWSISGSPTVTLVNNSFYGDLVKEATWPTASGYPNVYTVTLTVTAADGTVSDPDTATVAVQNPSPATPGTAAGGVKNLKRAILFDSGTDAAERNKRFGRVPDWSMHYLTATSWTTTLNELQSVASQSNATTKRIVNFGFTFPKQGGSNTLLGRTANTTEFDSQINRIGEITAGFSQATLNSLTYVIGWEHTGYWYSWGIQYGDGTNAGKATGATLTTRTTDFKTAFRKVANSIKNKCSAAGKTPPKIMWCCNSDPGDFHKTSLVLPSYPGDAYVDVVGFNIYDHFGWATPSNMDDWLAWFKDFALGRIRRTDAGAVTTGNPKLLGINEMSLHMKTKQETTKTFPWGGDVIYFHQKIYDWAQGSLTAPGLHHLGHFDQANTPQWFYGAVIHFSTSGTNATYGRAMTINDVLVAAAGQYQARELSPGVRSYTGYNAVGGTKTATYTSGAARAAQYIIDRVGGPLAPGE